jgi:uncharacterized protein YwqG
MGMTLPEQFEAFRLWFERHRRDSWTPVVVDGDGDPRASKFSGTAWLDEGEDWPHCPLCGEAMALFIQLDLSSAPQVHPALNSGLFQAFLCINMEKCVYGPSLGEPWATNHLFRVVESTAQGHAAIAPAGTAAATSIPPRTISGWEHADDFPSTVDGEERFGLRWGENTNFGQYEDVGEHIVCEDPKAMIPATLDDYWDLLPQASGGEKLGGWAAWANVYTDYPQCPDCGQTMDHMLFQFGYSGFVPVMFGDGGVGHILFCSQHPKNMAYVWQCG